MIHATDDERITSCFQGSDSSDLECLSFSTSPLNNSIVFLADFHNDGLYFGFSSTYINQIVPFLNRCTLLRTLLLRLKTDQRKII